MHGRSAFARDALEVKTDQQPFVADPPPEAGHVETVVWAKRQFDALQRVLEAQQSRIDALTGVGVEDVWDRS